MFKKSLKSVIQFICRFLPNFSYQKNYGFCPCCELQTSFISFSPWFRDNYRCINCFSIPRQRALLIAINKYYPDWNTLTIHESSPSKGGASDLLRKRCKNYIASQFFPNQPLGEIIDGFHNQNLENQTFKDESFDLVITQDVFEHVFEPVKAFKEIFRTLRPGGAHIFTVPIINRFGKTEIWASGNSENYSFLHSPEIHGNPVDRNGSPVTMHWGFDILDVIKDATKMETTIEDSYDLNYGLSGRYLEVFVSKKNS